MDSRRPPPGWTCSSVPNKISKAMDIFAEIIGAISQDDYTRIDDLKLALLTLLPHKWNWHQSTLRIEWTGVNYKLHHEAGCERIIE